MLEINCVNLPRPHENAQVHMQVVFQLRSGCCSLPHEVRGERWGVAVPHRVSPEERQEQTACYSTTQRSPNSPWYRWLVVQWINPSASPAGPESCCEMVIVI